MPQLIGVVAVGAFVFIVSIAGWAIIKAMVGLRVSRDEELEGPRHRRARQLRLPRLPDRHGGLTEGRASERSRAGPVIGPAAAFAHCGNAERAGASPVSSPGAARGEESPGSAFSGAARPPDRCRDRPRHGVRRRRQAGPAGASTPPTALPACAACARLSSKPRCARCASAAPRASTRGTSSWGPRGDPARRHWEGQRVGDGGKLVGMDGSEARVCRQLHQVAAAAVADDAGEGPPRVRLHAPVLQVRTRRHRAPRAGPRTAPRSARSQRG